MILSLQFLRWLFLYIQFSKDHSVNVFEIGLSGAREERDRDVGICVGKWQASGLQETHEVPGCTARSSANLENVEGLPVFGVNSCRDKVTE